MAALPTSTGAPRRLSPTSWATDDPYATRDYLLSQGWELTGGRRGVSELFRLTRGDETAILYLSGLIIGVNCRELAAKGGAA